METVTEMTTEERETKQNSSLTSPMSEAEYKFVCVCVFVIMKEHHEDYNTQEGLSCSVPVCKKRNSAPSCGCF